MDESEVPGKKKGFLGWSPERPHAAEAMMGIAGTAAVGLGNKSVGKQYWSGLHKHAIGAVIGGLIGNYIYRSVKQYNRSQQLLYEDYIRLHPEEFALVEKRTYGDILKPWYPTR